MVNVPNPFRMIDDVLLDYVFNPLTWRIEYQFGWNAMDVRVAVSYIGGILLLFASYLDRDYILFFLSLVYISAVWFAGLDLFQTRWAANNKTGKNIDRITGFPLRRFNDAMLFVQILLPDSTQLIYWVSLLGWALILSIATYLDATDAMPPHYHEYKEAPQF
jgi:hypothetical protein